MGVGVVEDYSTDEATGGGIHEIYDPNIISSIAGPNNHVRHNQTGSTYGDDLDYNTTWFAESNTTGIPDFNKPMLGFTAGSAFVIAVLGTIGNLLTIIALPMNRRLRNSGTALVVNLAVAELLFCTIVLPLSGVQLLYLQDNQNLLDDHLCSFFVAFRYTVTQAQLQTILAIALTRAIAVSFPHAYVVVNRLDISAVYIALIWIYSFLIRLPIIIGKFGHYELNLHTMECDVTEQAPDVRLVYLVVEAAIPVLLIIFFYIIITIMIVKNGIIKARHRKKSQTAYSASNPSSTVPTQSEVIKNATKVSRASEASLRRIGVVTQPSISSTTGTSSSSSDGAIERKESTSSFKSFKRMVSVEGSIRSGVFRRSSSLQRRLNTHRRDIRVVRSIFVIFVLLLVGSVPVAVEHTLATVKGYDNYDKLLGLHVLYWLQYCLNMFVYVLMNRQYRDAYIDCIAKIVPGWERHRGFRFFWENQSVNSKPTIANHNSSIKASQKPNSEPKVPPSPEPKGERSPFIEKRLSTIPEGHSSSAAAALEDSISEQKTDNKSEEHHEDENSNFHVDKDFNAYSGDIDADGESDDDSFSKSFDDDNEYLNGGPRYDRYETDSEEEQQMGRMNWCAENGTNQNKSNSSDNV
ncbi:unnamed protein product [Meganyctiphanes norvegica]|uniref:G-protein coupled receptors family 1 profile domain-containing protein n=1 Tax=Meganyctiphanes norvegica TaxID=48144 RepID=A0AAV2PJZ0_MEGNR